MFRSLESPVNQVSVIFLLMGEVPWSWEHFGEVLGCFIEFVVIWINAVGAGGSGGILFKVQQQEQQIGHRAGV